jgi:hypothetical protein
MSVLLLDPAQREESQTHEFIAISSILSRVVVQSLAIMMKILLACLISICVHALRVDGVAIHGANP